jgi:prepilin-type N-terminal cleavage/methylation domain-containing protein
VTFIHRARHAAGFTLIEVLIAIGIFVTMAIGVAQIIALSIEATRAGREHTSAVILAGAKLEELRDQFVSPSGTLASSVPPYVDYLDETGSVVGSGADPPGNAVFVRRWSIVPLPADPARMLAVSVLVTTVRLERLRGGPWQRRTGVEALLVSVRTRREP